MNEDQKTTTAVIDDVIKLLKAQADKAAEHRDAAEADGTSDYDYWEGYLAAIDLSIDLLQYDL